MSKRITNTDRAELVETHNLVLALNALGGVPYDGDRWKRALYHSLTMSNVCHKEIAKKIREALELP